jgi:hypothetical protein
MMRSGVPICHASSSGNWTAGGMSAALPRGAPASTQLAIVAISLSLSEGSFLKWRMPTLRSMNHGGISRAVIRCLIALAYGRTSSYERSDIGAIEPGRWQFWHDRWRIGATSLVNVTAAVVIGLGV